MSDVNAVHSTDVHNYHIFMPGNLSIKLKDMTTLKYGKWVRMGLFLRTPVDIH